MTKLRTQRPVDGGPLMLELEPRILLSADLPGDALVDAVLSDPQSPVATLVNRQHESTDRAEIESQQRIRELVVIDATTPNAQLLLTDLISQLDDGRILEVAVLDGDRDGIDQISELLAGRDDLDALHIISHGRDGSVLLGAGEIDQDELVTRAAAIQGWSDAFAADGDILIYGCNLAAGPEGRAFVGALARLTGTDVAASEDLTGSASLGGDWNLEYRVGDVDAIIAVSAAAQAEFNAILPGATPTASDDPITFSSEINSYSPLGYWRLGESAGTTIVDASGTNDGTWRNSPTLGSAGALADDATNTAVTFDGTVNDDTGDYGEIAHHASYLVDEGSVQLWFNTADVTQDSTLWSKDSTNFDTGGHLKIDITPTSHISVRLQSIDTSYTIESTTALTANDWHQVVFTFGPAGMQLYVDGVLEASDAYAGGLGTSSGGAGNFEPIVIGASTGLSDDLLATPTGRHFDGRIDEATMLSQVLTPEQVRELYGAAGQHYTIDQDTTLNVAAQGGVLATDYDADGDPLTASLVNGPTNAGSFTLNPDGSFDYTPVAGWSGTDTFTYRANDGTLDSNIAVVTLSVNATANSAPVIADWYDSNWLYRKEIVIDGSQVVGNLTDFPVLIDLLSDAELAAFAQGNGDDILFTAADGTTKLSHEIQSFTGGTGALTAWVRSNLAAGTDTRIYLYYGNASAGNQEDVANVWDANFEAVLHLEETPTGSADDIQDSTANANDGTTEGSMDGSDLVAAQIGQGLDFDEVDDLIRMQDSASLESTVNAATFELWIWWDDTTDGDHQIVMTNSNRFVGARDGIEWASQADGDHFFYPSGEIDPSYVLGPDPYTDQTWQHVAVTLDYAANDVQIYVDGVAMSFTEDHLATGWLNPADPDDWLWGGNPDRATRFFDGMMDEIRISSTVRSVEWIRTSVNNQGNAAGFITLGSAETELMTLTDVAENDANPPGDTVLTMIQSVGGDRIVDADSGALEGVAVVGVDDTNGQWQYDAGGGWEAFGGVNDTNAVLLDTSAIIRFVPNASYSGPSGDITFYAWDQTIGANGDTGVDVSTRGDATPYSLNSDTASLTVLDLTAPVVTVDPLSTNDSTPQLTGTVDDNAATIQVTVDGNVYAATNNGDGTWTLADNTITPALADGTYDVAVTATDPFSNVGTDGTTNELVVATNVAPVATDDAYSVLENGSLTTISGVDDLLLNDTDADLDPLAVNTTPVVAPANGILVLNADGTFTYTPTAGFDGVDAFTYEISDGNGGFDQAVVTITVVPVNVAPTPTPDSYTIGEDGSLVTGAAAGVLANDTDPDGDPMSVTTTAVVAPTDGVLMLAADGSFTYSPDPDFNGSDSFVYEVSDGNGGLAQANVTIDVAPVNDTPVAAADNLTIQNTVPLVFSSTDMLGNDSDVDGDPLSILAYTSPANGTLVDDGNGNYIYTADAGFEGIDSFAYTVQDSAGAMATATVIVDVTAGSGGWLGEDPPPDDGFDPPATTGDDTTDPTGDDPADDEPPATGSDEPTVAEVIATDGSLSVGDVPMAEEFSGVRWGNAVRPVNVGDDDNRRDAAGIPAKYLYDTISALAEGFEFQGFGLKNVNLNHEALWQALDTMKREMRNLGEDGDGDTAAVVTQIAAGTSIALSAGFISWVLRGGALASMLLSTMPMWKGFDPLPLLAARRRKEEDETKRTKRLKDGAWAKAIKAERMFFNADSGNGEYTPRRSDRGDDES